MHSKYWENVSYYYNLYYTYITTVLHYSVITPLTITQATSTLSNQQKIENITFILHGCQLTESLLALLSNTSNSNYTFSTILNILFEFIHLILPLLNTKREVGSFKIPTLLLRKLKHRITEQLAQSFRLGD